MKLDSAVVRLLQLDPDATTVSSAGGGGMSSASTSKITTKRPDGSTMHYFMKTGKGEAAEVMFAGEHASLNAIHDVVPTLCPQSFGHGRFADGGGASSSSSTSFLVTDFLDLSGRSSVSGASSGGGGGSEDDRPMSLAQKLAKLHTTPAPTPAGHTQPQFGFPAPTCCGDTAQDNTYSGSWADFYATRRLRFIRARAEAQHGGDGELHALVEQTCRDVVPRLLGDGHLGGARGIAPVVVHGDLWSGNAGTGRLPGMPAPEPVVYDSSACYAHAEFELGIMRMFGGFGPAFLREYHALVPKTEPVAEYEDRVSLYEVYHHLNHHALFGGGYRGGAVGIMRGLIGKYGAKSEL